MAIESTRSFLRYAHDFSLPLENCGMPPLRVSPAAAATSPLRALSEPQQGLLGLLQREKGGLTVDDLAERLAVTRTAVRQHLAALERDGYVQRQVLRQSIGRPRHVYTLTMAGDYLFPKQYLWFSALLLEALKQEMGEEGLIEWLRRLALRVAEQISPQPAGPSLPERAEALVRSMNELGYDAQVTGQSGDAVEVVASNCVYYELARAFPEVCHFDYGLLEGLGAIQKVEHLECMVRGGRVCHFLLLPSSLEKTGRKT